jgi:hypothetical protein
MPPKLDKVNLKFRQLVDLLFYSDRMDLDLSGFKHLLKENYEIHFEYIWDRFKRCSEISWENGEQFWSHRLTFLLSLNEKTLSKYIEDYLEKRMFALVRTKHEPSIRYDIEYLQFLELCKIRSSRHEDLTSVKNYLTEMPAYLNLDKVIAIVNSFIPIVFADMNEFAQVILKKITYSVRSFDLLCSLEQRGIKFDKRPIINLIKEILIERKHSEKNIRAFFSLLNDKQIAASFKKEYLPAYKSNLIKLINACDYQMIEEYHLRNIKNIITLDSTVADELSFIYADKLYARYTGHKKANADRLIRLLKTIPEISSKKILVYLSNNNYMSDIKYILSAFPELKKLAAFM